MKNSLTNKYFAVFVILSFLIYVMSNGEWCVPIFAWIYPILFLYMIDLNHTRKYILSFVLYMPLDLLSSLEEPLEWT